MFFTLSKVLWFIADPGNLLVILLCLGAVFAWFRWHRWARGVVTITALFALVLAVVPVGEALTRALENRFPRPDGLPQEIGGIIVLGGVLDPVGTTSRGTPALGGAVERLTAFAELAHLYPHATLIFTGGSGSLVRQDLKEADFIAPLLARFGLAPERVKFENQSRNTAENARLSRPLAGEDGKAPWVLITSAFHMPRAVGAFRAAGWRVVPYPVDYNTSVEAMSLGFNLRSGLGAFAAGTHEFLGLIFYRLTGRSDAWFPAPA